MDALLQVCAVIGRRLIATFESGYGLDEGYFQNDIDTQAAAV